MLFGKGTKPFLSLAMSCQLVNAMTITYYIYKRLSLNNKNRSPHLHLCGPWRRMVPSPPVGARMGKLRGAHHGYLAGRAALRGGGRGRRRREMPTLLRFISRRPITRPRAQRRLSAPAMLAGETLRPSGRASVTAHAPVSRAGAQGSQSTGARTARTVTPATAVPGARSKAVSAKTITGETCASCASSR